MFAEQSLNPNPRILILGDLTEQLATNLRISGYSTKGTSNSVEVFEALQIGDVLIMDSSLPEMTGLEVARRAYALGWRGFLLLMSRLPAAGGKGTILSLLNALQEKPLLLRERERRFNRAKSTFDP